MLALGHIAVARADGDKAMGLRSTLCPESCALPCFALLPQWYTTAVDYWDKQEASVNGVLGGYGHLTTADVRDSRAFLQKVRPG